MDKPLYMYVELPKQFDVAKVEDKYSATYMGMWEIRQSRGWVGPIAVFYQPNPDVSKGHSPYFGLYVQNKSIMITNAESFKSEGFECLHNPDTGEIIVSTHVHDFRSFRDGGEASIDGGREYCRVVGNRDWWLLGLHNRLTVVDGVFISENNTPVELRRL